MTYEILEAILSDRLSLAIIDAVVKGTVILCLAMCGTVLLRRASAAVRHRLWALALGGLLVLPLLSWLVPGWQIAVLPERSSRATDVEQSDSMNGSAPQAQANAANDSSLQDDATERQIGHAKSAASLAELPPPVAVPAAASESEANVGSRIARALFALWAVGSVIAVLPLLIGIAGNEWRRRRSRPVTGPEWVGLLGGVLGRIQQRTHWGTEPAADAPRSPLRLFLRIGWARIPALRQTTESLIPLTWGIVRPVILLPADADRWTEPVRRHVLLHELAHIRRFDVAYQIVGRLAAAMYWFHPLAWYALHRLRAESEHACDDCVVSAGEPACEYAQHLLDLALCLRSPRLVAAVGMARTNALEQRMRWLFDGASSHVPLGRRGARLLLVAAICLIGGLAVVEPGRSVGNEVVAGEDRAEKLPDGTKSNAKGVGGIDEPPSDPKRTEKFFEKRYSLVAGQVFKRVGPPYVKGRLDQYRAKASAEQQAAMPDGPGHSYFYWESGKPRLWKSDFNDEGVPLNALLHELAGIHSIEMDGDANLWVMTKIEGDFVLRKGAPLDEIVNAVEEMLNDDLEIPSRLEFREVEREAYVVRGEFAGKPTGPPWRPGDASYLIYGKQGPAAHPNGASNAGTFVELLKTVGDRVGSPIVVDVAEPPKDYFGWQVYFDDPDRTIWSEFPRHFAKNPSLVLQHVSEQTGLTFTKEKRVVNVLYLERRKEGEARRAASSDRSEAAFKDDRAKEALGGEPASPGKKRESELPETYTHPITVTGRALDKDGKPVPGAKIYLASLRVESKRLAEAVSDSEGRYEFHEVPLPIGRSYPSATVDMGAFEVFGQAGGYGFAWRPMKWFDPARKPANAPAVDPLNPDAERPEIYGTGEPIKLDLQFPRSSRLSGRIVDDLDKPISSVRVNLRRCVSLLADHPATAHHDFAALFQTGVVPIDLKSRVTDADGRFEFTGLPPNCRFEIEARATSLLTRKFEAATTEIPQPPHEGAEVLTGELKLTFATPREVRVKVVYGDSYKPAPKLLVQGGNRSVSSLPSTDSDGYATLQLPPGEYRLQLLPAYGTPYLVTNFDLVVDRDSTAIVRALRPAAVVDVTVLDAETGEGIAGVDLWRETQPGTPDTVPVGTRKAHNFRSWEMETRTVHGNPPRTDAAGKLRALFEPGRHRIGIGMDAYPQGYAVVEADGQEINCHPGKPVQVTFTMRKVAAAAPRD